MSAANNQQQYQRQRLLGLPIAARMLLRDWRSGELRILAAALIIAVAAVTAINLMTDRFGSLLQRESAELVGGDLVIQSTREPDPKWLEQGQALGLKTAEVIEFSSVVLFGDELLLTSNKAASDSYPLLGALRSSGELYGEEQSARQPPAPGTVWVDARVLGRLGAELGDRITIGSAEFTIARVLTYEPDRSGNLFNLAPRILLNLSDLAAAEVLGPGSRVTYRYLFAGNSAESLKAMLQPQLGPGHRLIDASGGEGRSGDAMVRAEQFLGLTALLAIFLATIAIAMAARRYSERHYDTSGMLRCLGVQQSQIMQLYSWQLVLLALFAALLGTIAGWLGHMGLIAVIADLLPPYLPAAGIAPYLTGGVTAFCLMIGIALPPVLRLKSVPPLRVFRRELIPMPTSGWLVYGFAVLALSGVIWLLFDEVGVLLLILLGGGLAIGVLGVLLYSALRVLRRLLPARGSLLLRSLRNLSAHAATSAGQLLSFGLTAMVMVTLLLLRTDLVDQWHAQLPEDVPNNFVFNIQPSQRDTFSSALAQESINATLYPIVRGRIAAVNGQLPPAHAGQDDSGREINFTWAEQLPDQTRVLEGSWSVGSSSKPVVSIEQGFAERLGAVVGDRITVNIAGGELTAEINSVREVDWESFSPNFFMIFSAGALDGFPVSYLTSFRLDEAQKPLLNQLIREFPAVSVIEVDALVEQVEKVLNQVILMVEMMLAFVLLAGVVVLLASIQATLDERLREGALMRAIGASRRYLRTASITEFALLGALAGLLACVGVQLTCSAIYQRVFDMSYTADPWLWLLIPAILAVGVGMAGYVSTRKVVEVSPRQLLSGS